MKKLFGTLLAALVLLTATVTHAAKVQPLAEIDAYNFFLNMGYEVDCSHWERYEGKQLYAVMIPEDPLIISKDFANIELCAEMRKEGRVADVTLFFKAGSSGDEMSVIVIITAKITFDNKFSIFTHLLHLPHDLNDNHGLNHSVC